MRFRVACVVAAIAAGVVPATASGADWPRRLFAIARVHDPLRDAVQDFVERPDGSIVIASGSAYGPSGHVRELSPTGRLRRVATFRGRSGNSGIGILADGPKAFLVADGWGDRVWRVLPSGAKQVVAGIGKEGFRGDGGPARAARLRFHTSEHLGLARLTDGSVVFTDAWNERVRRIRPDGVIETIAGSGPPPPSSTDGCTGGDGGPATRAEVCLPADVLATADGGFIVADVYPGLIRRVAPDGTITTIAGDGSGGPRYSYEDGRPATDVSLTTPEGLAELPDGELLISDAGRISRLAPDGRLYTFLNLGYEPLIDFDGRWIHGTPTGLEPTREGGLLIGAGDAYYLAPPHTWRTLVRIRGARVRRGKVTLHVEGTRTARATTTVRGTRARSTRTIRAGDRTLAVHGAFADRPYRVRVALRGPHGATAADAVSLYLGARLRKPYVHGIAARFEDEDETLLRCRRYSPRRVDCVFTSDAGCDEVLAFTLRRTGVIWRRPYGCTDVGHPFRAHPAWTDRAWPLGAPSAASPRG